MLAFRNSGANLLTVNSHEMNNSGSSAMFGAVRRPPGATIDKRLHPVWSEGRLSHRLGGPINEALYHCYCCWVDGRRIALDVGVRI